MRPVRWHRLAVRARHALAEKTGQPLKSTLGSLGVLEGGKSGMSEAIRWEYRVLANNIYQPTDPKRIKPALDELNQLGEHGWEVAGAWGDSIGHGWFLLKRPK
jgi:hypothetical protein